MKIYTVVILKFDVKLCVAFLFAFSILNLQNLFSSPALSDC